MFYLGLIEILFLTNLLSLTCLLNKKITRKLGILMLTIGLMWLLALTVKLEPHSIIILGVEQGNYFFGAFSVDKLSGFFAAITFFLTFMCLSFYNTKNYNQVFYIVIFFLLEFFLFHTFNSLNMLTFYGLFESTLIPMFLLILFWGGRQRRLHAMYMFFFYTAFGSIFLLAGILIFFANSGSVLGSFVTRVEPVLSFYIVFMWFCMFIGFGFKVPITPAHTWLPEAHVEAPTVGSIILAGLLLKIGTFGMLRFMFPALNILNLRYQTIVFILCVFSLYYASLVAVRQLDMKKIVAYSSVAHMAFVVIGLFSINIYGFVGSIFTMISHGIVAPALFFLVGVLYDRYGSRILLNYGGISSVMPLYSTIFFFFILANIGFPSTSNFIGELLILLGVMSTNVFIAIITTFSIVLAPIYSLWMYNRVFFGALANNLVGFFDLTYLEFFFSIVLITIVFIVGLFPNIITSYVELEFLKYNIV